MKVIIFVCESCNHTNAQLLGTDGFELLKYEYDSLTEAFDHIIETGGKHHMVATIMENGEH
jgi:hypothetical protein